MEKKIIVQNWMVVYGKENILLPLLIVENRYFLNKQGLKVSYKVIVKLSSRKYTNYLNIGKTPQ